MTLMSEYLIDMSLYIELTMILWFVSEAEKQDIKGGKTDRQTKEKSKQK